MKILTVLMTLAIMASPALAEGTNGDSVVLTPTALYDKIEKLEAKHSKVLKVLLKQNKRLVKLEKEVAELKK